MDASIVIPVKNGGNRLKEVLEVLRQQQTKYSYEIIVVDSGSTDDSITAAKKYADIVKEIPSSEFGHGKTRNLGASLGTGEFIIFLTQDALPASKDWLEQMLDAMHMWDDKMEENNPATIIAGAFGQHYPYPECNLPDQQMLQNHFARFDVGQGEPTVFQLEDARREEYAEDRAGYAQYLTFFSDNDSCLRRSVWEKIPYDDVDFSEDQIWARKIIEAGYGKAYVPKAAVYHSHNYPMKEYGKRYFDDFKAVYRVHSYVMCPTKKAFLKVWYQNLRHEAGYIKRREDISLGKKIYWCFYSLRRNYIRNRASVNAVKYFTLSEDKKKKLDAKYSQQVSQRK